MKDKVIIPAFVSSEFRDLKSKEQIEEFLTELRIWKSSRMTEQLLAYLDKELASSVKKEDDKDGFLSRFQMTYTIAHSKGYRAALRALLKQIGD